MSTILHTDDIKVDGNEVSPNKMGHVVDRLYAKYVLVVLTLVYVFNFIDRQILAILAEEIKKDIGISDGDLGFLFGTAFAVFYATFGIALGRLADIWNRKKLITLGLGFWSLMTALSGLARGFFPLAICRFGVGVGEASASPAAFSMLYDYFSTKARTTALAIYSSGVYIGGGLGLFLGGSILDAWHVAWPDASLAPFGLKGWQAAFIIVGLPGLFMAVWVSTLREPIRGKNDGIINKPHPRPFRETATVLMSMLPVGNLWVLVKRGVRIHTVVVNIISGITITFAAYSLIRFTGSITQWAALGIGLYAVISWAQSLSLRDPVVFGMIFKCPTLLYIVFALGTTTFMGVAIPFWSVPFYQRYHGVNASDVGIVLGVASAIMGLAGIIIGGILADKLYMQTRRGKLYVVLGSILSATVSAFLFLTTSHLVLAYAGSFLLIFTIAMGHGPALSTINDLVLPRGRATASAFAFMISTFVGVALGPYLIGHISDSIASSELISGEALRQAMLWSLFLPVVGSVLIVQALRNINIDEYSLLNRARALGEDL